ncbi:hypothetical protein ABFS83_12G054500 [Erythranthe nasuta]
MKEKNEETNSPAQKVQQIVSDDDEIDYSVKPEFYDPKIDERNEKWVKKQRRGFSSDAVLSCPACFTTLSFDCQRHDKYLTQYRAIFVENCRIKEEVATPGSKRKRNKKGSSQSEEGAVATETYKSVCCSVCSTNVGVIDEDEVYHFFNVLPSEA